MRYRTRPLFRFRKIAEFVGRCRDGGKDLGTNRSAIACHCAELRSIPRDTSALISRHDTTRSGAPPSVRCTYVVCAEDQVVSLEWSRRFAHRIGADIVELPGSHSPLLSRPSAVADVLLRVADEGDR
jgi:hypothetical protein